MNQIDSLSKPKTQLSKKKKFASALVAKPKSKINKLGNLSKMRDSDYM